MPGQNGRHDPVPGFSMLFIFYFFIFYVKNIFFFLIIHVNLRPWHSGYIANIRQSTFLAWKELIVNDFGITSP